MIDFEGWVRIGTRAGLVPGMAGQCAHALIELGIQDAHTGRRALERLAERLSRLKNPTGFFRTMLTQDGGPDPSIASFKRDRTTTARRAKLLDAMDGWPPDALGIVAAKTRALLERELGEDIARELIPAGQFAHPIRGWAEMLDFIAARYDDIRAVQLQAEAVA